MSDPYQYNTKGSLVASRLFLMQLVQGFLSFDTGSLLQFPLVYRSAIKEMLEVMIKERMVRVRIMILMPQIQGACFDASTASDLKAKMDSYFREEAPLQPFCCCRRQRGFQDVHRAGDGSVIEDKEE